MANLYRRMTYTVLDEYGVDSLKDKALNVIDQIEDYQEITIGLELEANLPLIAYKFYGNKDLWWIITAYNGILDINEDYCHNSLLVMTFFCQLMTVHGASFHKGLPI